MPLSSADVTTDGAIARTLPPSVASALALVLVVGAFVARGACAAALAVPLVLDESAGIARAAFPATASVPLPRGRLRTPDRLWLASPHGRAAPLQARPLATWPDGSIRWLLLDFLADVPANGHAVYTLRDGKPPPAESGPPPRVKLTRGDGWTLDTGVLRAGVPARGAPLVTELRAAGAELGPVAVPLLTADAATGPAVPEAARVETEGPVRTELVVTGRYPAGLAYEIRLAAFAGQPFLRVQHTVTNLSDVPYLPIRSLVLTLPGPFSGGAVGIDGARRALDARTPPHELRHDDAIPALLDGTRAGRHADSWARATSDGLAATLIARYPWQEWPKALRLGQDGLALDLFAGGAQPVRLGTGAARTHEFWIVLEPAGEARDPAALAAALTEPLAAVPPPAWTVTTRALPQALSPEDPDAADFLTRLRRAYDGYRERVRSERWDDGPPVACAARTAENPRTGFYGTLNWGDWQFPGYRDSSRGCDGWGNLEYDLPQVLALAWAATRARPFYDGLVPAARHYRDIDIIHHAPQHPDWVGLNHPHKPLHFAMEARETVDLGHTWAEGLVSFWWLTGEVRALAAARALGDALAPRVARARNPRQFGWPMLALVAVYEATGERRYLQAAEAYAEAALVAFRPTPAAGDWKMGILADGLAAVDGVSRNPRVRRWLVSYADAYAAAPDHWKDPRFALPLGYLAAATGDQRYARAARRAARGLRIGAWGKPLAAAGRTGFRLLAPLAGQASAPRTPERPAATHGTGSDGMPLRPGRDAPPPGSRGGRRGRSPSR